MDVTRVLGRGLLSEHVRALGWPEGCLPDRPALLAHMLHCVEYEYAAHCFYDHVPGKRCSVCSFDPKKTRASLYAMTRDSDSDDAPDGGVDCEDDRDAIYWRRPTGFRRRRNQPPGWFLLGGASCVRGLCPFADSRVRT